MTLQVVLPIPRPVGLVGNEEYKLSFSFEGEHATPDMDLGTASHPARMQAVDQADGGMGALASA